MKEVVTVVTSGKPVIRPAAMHCFDGGPETSCHIGFSVLQNSGMQAGSWTSIVTIPVTKEEWIQMKRDVDTFFKDQDDWNGEGELN